MSSKGIWLTVLMRSAHFNSLTHFDVAQQPLLLIHHVINLVVADRKARTHTNQVGKLQGIYKNNPDCHHLQLTVGIWLVRLPQTIKLSTDLHWRINYIQCCVPLILTEL